MSDEDKNVDLGESKAPELYGITFSLLGVTIVVVALRSVTFASSLIFDSGTSRF